MKKISWNKIPTGNQEEDPSSETLTVSYNRTWFGEAQQG